MDKFEVKPLTIKEKGIKVSDLKELKKDKIDERFPQHKFRLYIVAPTSTGKSTLLYRLLDKVYCGKFDEIHIYSPTLGTDPTFYNLVSKDSKDCLPINMIHETYSTKELNKLKEHFDEIKEGKPNARFLLVFDDFLSFPDEVPFATKKDKTLFSIRHHNCSVIALSQTFKGIHPQSRSNMSHFCFLKQANIGEIKKIAEELCGAMTEKNFILWLAGIFDEDPYGFGYIDITKPGNEQHRNGFGGQLAPYKTIKEQLKLEKII